MTAESEHQEPKRKRGRRALWSALALTGVLVVTCVRIDDGIEPNNDFETATLLDTNNWLEMMVTEDDRDVFMVQAEPGECVSFSIGFEIAEEPPETWSCHRYQLVDPELRQVLDARFDEETGALDMGDADVRTVTVTAPTRTGGPYYLIVETAFPRAMEDPAESCPGLLEFGIRGKATSKCGW